MKMFSWERLSMEILPTCSPLWLELPQPWGLESATLTCQGSKGKLAQHPWHNKQLQNLGTALPAEWGTSGTVERSVRNTLAQIPCRSGFLLFGDKEESSIFQLSLPFPTTAQWLPQPMSSFKSTLESMSRCELDPSTSIQCGAFLTHCNEDNIASWPKNQDFEFSISWEWLCAARQVAMTQSNANPTNNLLSQFPRFAFRHLDWHP